MFGQNVADKYALAITKNLGFGMQFLALICVHFPYHASFLRVYKYQQLKGKEKTRENLQD